MDYPLISVIIPCYNQAHLISDALDALLAQTYNNLEVIIVDDYSTDDLAAAVAPYLAAYNHIRLYANKYGSAKKTNALYGSTKNTDSGWAARNFGVDQAKGEYITFQDADDGSCSNRIERQYTLLKEYDVLHVAVDWQQFQKDLNCKPLQAQYNSGDLILTKDIVALARTTKKGIFTLPFGSWKLSNIFRKIDRKWFRDWTPYPCAASMPLVHRSVFERCKFRPIEKRQWPSIAGRGADRDFNFWVTETFESSIAIREPLILWRVKNQNSYYDKQ